MNEKIYNKCFMVESDKQDRNEDSFRAIRLDDLFKITDKYNSADNLEKENAKLKQQLQAYKDKENKLIKWCYEHGQAINATDILDIIDPTILEGDK